MSHDAGEKIGLIGNPTVHAGIVAALQPLRIETIAPNGAYAVSFTLDIPEAARSSNLRVTVDIEVESGAIGIGCMTHDFSRFVEPELVVPAGGRRKVSVAMGMPRAARHLMLRNASDAGPSVARVYGIDIRRHQLDGDELFGDLDELGRATAENAPLPFLFCVVSWGCAATQWLANTLNGHPDIFCVHSENQFWRRLGGARGLDGWQYLRILGCESPASRACGDVHGVSRESIPDLRGKLGYGFNCAILVREPLPRLRSQMAHFENFPVKSPWKIDYVQNFVDAGVPLPHDNVANRLFLHGVNMLNSIIQEEPIAPLWRSEDLTTNGPMLARFIEELTRGHVEVEPEWANRAVRRPPSNRHRDQNAPAPEFEPWQIEAIREIVKPRAWEIYKMIGYDTPDFIR